MKLSLLPSPSPPHLPPVPGDHNQPIETDLVKYEVKSLLQDYPPKISLYVNVILWLQTVKPSPQYQVMPIQPIETELVKYEVRSPWSTPRLPTQNLSIY